MHIGKVRQFGLAPIIVAGTLIFASGAQAGPGDCVANPFISDPFQCEQERPIQLGVSGSSIEHIIDFPYIYCYTGTLGSLVIDEAGKKYILSNNHVLAKEGAAPIGEQTIQPGLLDEGTCTSALGDPTHAVGALSDYVALQYGRGRNRPINYADAAIAEIDVGKVVSNGYIRDIGPLTAVATTVVLGDLVQKSGRTTGHTFGKVEATNVTVNVAYDGGTARFRDQLEVIGCANDFSDSGDSGSLIMTLPGTYNNITVSDRSAVGLLFAGGAASTFANRIHDVFDELTIPVKMVIDTSVATPDDVTGNDDALINCLIDNGGGTLDAADDSYTLSKNNSVLSVSAPGVLGNDSNHNGTATLIGPNDLPHGILN